MKVLGLLAIVLLVLGCALPDSKYLTDELHLGQYPLPPPGYTKITLAIGKFVDKRAGGHTQVIADHAHLPRTIYGLVKPPVDLSRVGITPAILERDLAKPIPDMLMTLLYRSGRFRVVDRQTLWRLWPAGQQARLPRSFLGAQWLLTGALTQFEIRTATNYYKIPLGLMLAIGLTVARVDTGGNPWIIGAVIGDLDLAQKRLTVTIGLSARIIDVPSGTVVMAETVEVSREEKASAFSLALFSSQGEFYIDACSAGRQLRFAVDALLRKMFIRLDREQLTKFPTTSSGSRQAQS